MHVGEYLHYMLWTWIKKNKKKEITKVSRTGNKRIKINSEKKFKWKDKYKKNEGKYRIYSCISRV